MPRLQLLLYLNPGAADIFFNIKLKDGTYRRYTGTVDTGAEVSLLPRLLMDEVEFRLSEEANIVIDQAGIAVQSFEALEAVVTIFLEDQTGQQTNSFPVKVWFADTDQFLIGFDDILDQAVLHIDMQNRDGWIELDP